MKKSIGNYAILAEVVLSFAIPVVSLANGVVTLPVWVAGAIKGAGFAVVNVLCIVGGCLGIWAVQEATKYCLAEWPKRKSTWFLEIVCADFGVVAIWTVATGQFTGLELNWFTILFAVVPTLSTIHIFVLAMRRARQLANIAGPSNALQSREWS